MPSQYISRVLPSHCDHLEIGPDPEMLVNSRAISPTLVPWRIGRVKRRAADLVVRGPRLNQVVLHVAREPCLGPKTAESRRWVRRKAIRSLPGTTTDIARLSEDAYLLPVGSR